MDIQKLTQLIKLHEAGDRPRQRLYDDRTDKLVTTLPSGGKATIGWGRNLSDCEISVAEANMLLANDVERAILDCENSFPFFGALDDVRQAVLVDLVFNVGLAELSRWKNTLGAVERGAFVAAGQNLLATEPWRSQVKGRATRLAAMMETGEWPRNLGG